MLPKTGIGTFFPTLVESQPSCVETSFYCNIDIETQRLKDNQHDTAQCLIN